VQIEEAKNKFIQSWGTLGSQWGINRTMSQIHALLLISQHELSAEDIMEQLSISRGNANMNIRALMDWGLVTKSIKPGDRKEYFNAGKDIWEAARKITFERRRRELEPLMQMIEELKKEQIVGEDSSEVEAFNHSINEISNFTSKANQVLDKFIRSDENWFYKTLLQLVK